MRLFLSSENLGNYPEVFLKMLGDNKKLAVIHNAIDDQTAEYKNTKMHKHSEQLKSLSFEPTELDLRGYFGKKGKLAEKMKEFAGVYVFGGNTFILRRAMAASGFDNLITKLLENDEIAYGGSSAGSCVVAKTLHGNELGDRPQPEDVPDNYPSKEIIWDGLGLVDFMVVPHFGSTWFGNEADATVKYLKSHNLPYKILEDGQVYIIDGEKQELLK